MKFFVPLSFAAIIIAGWTFVAGRYSVTNVPIRLEPVPHAKFDPNAIERNIAFNLSRVRRDPQGAIGWAMLADAYLAKSREYDSDRAAWSAEAAARKSLSLRTLGNDRGRTVLVNSLLEQHRFQDALATLDALKIRAERTRVDVLIEMGRYEEATKLLSTLNPADPSGIASRARLMGLKGDRALAVVLLKEAREMSAIAGVGETTLAWYSLKLGDQLLAKGDRTAARASYEETLRLHPRNYKAHLALARLNLADKRFEAAIRQGQETMRIANSLDARDVIADAYRGLGNTAEAERWYASCLAQFRAEIARFDRLGKGGPFRVRPIDRQFATFAAEHRRYVAEAIPAARRDMANRPDPDARRVLAELTGRKID